MSQENVEIVKAAIDAWNREDWDAMLRDMAPGFELDLSRAVGPHHGVFNVDEVRRVLEEFTAGWESFRVEAHEFTDAGELVVEPQTAHFKGRDGIEASATVTFVWTIRDGAIERVVMYQDRKDALEAGGCRSKTLTPTPEAAGYCAGDVAGGRGQASPWLRGPES